MVMKNKSKSMRKEEVTNYFEALFRNFSKKTENNPKNRYVGRDSSQGPCEFKKCVLPTYLPDSVVRSVEARIGTTDTHNASVSLSLSLD